MRQGSQKSEQVVHRSVVVKAIFGGDRKALEKAIKADRAILAEFENGAWLSWRQTNGGRQFVLKGDEAHIQKVMVAIRSNQLADLLKKTMN